MNIQTYKFTDDGKIPNHPDLELVIYSDVLQEASCKDLFLKNGWDGVWVNGIFPYHHFHSTAHEVLGVIQGEAIVQFGGKQGEAVKMKQGDVAVIPAGVGHKNIQSSSDFSVVGAYPKGQKWDLCIGKPEERPGVLENIRKVPLPKKDPVFGDRGPLIELWLK